MLEISISCNHSCHSCT